MAMKTSTYSHAELRKKTPTLDWTALLHKVYPIGSMYGICTIIYLHLVDFHGKLVGRYTNPMDPPWDILKALPPFVPVAPSETPLLDSD